MWGTRVARGERGGLEGCGEDKLSGDWSMEVATDEAWDSVRSGVCTSWSTWLDIRRKGVSGAGGC